MTAAVVSGSVDREIETLLICVTCVCLCSQCRPLQVTVQQVLLFGLQCLAVDTILPLLIDPLYGNTTINTAVLTFLC